MDYDLRKISYDFDQQRREEIKSYSFAYMYAFGKGLASLANYIDFMQNKRFDKTGEMSAYLTMEKMREKIAIKRRKLEKFRKIFCHLGLLAVEKKGCPPKVYYHLKSYLAEQFSRYLECREHDSELDFDYLVETLPIESVKKDIQDTRDFFRKKHKNSAPKKEIPIKKSSVPKKEKPANKHPLVEYWNNLPNTRKHKNPSTKTYKKAVRFFGMMKAGKFDTLSVKNIDKRSLAEKLTDNDIRETLNDMVKYYHDDYWPADKSKVPKDLHSMLYNPQTGTSWFYNAIISPPQKISEAYFKEQEEKYDERYVDNYNFMTMRRRQSDRYSRLDFYRAFENFEADIKKEDDAGGFFTRDAGRILRKYITWLRYEHDEEFYPKLFTTTNGWYKRYVKETT